MAQFRATIQGQRGQASRLGSKKSGITADVNGWRSGVRIEGTTRLDVSGDEYDEFRVYATAGSGKTHSPILIGTIKLNGYGPEFVPESK